MTLNVLFFPIRILDDKRDVRFWESKNFDLPVQPFTQQSENCLFNMYIRQQLFSKTWNEIKKKSIKIYHTKRKKSITSGGEKIFQLEPEWRLNHEYMVEKSNNVSNMKLDTMIDVLHSLLGYSKGYLKSLFLVKQEYKQQLFNRKIKLTEMKESNWISHMKNLLYYILENDNCDELNDILEKLDHFRFKLCNDSYKVTDKLLKERLTNDELWILAALIHKLNILLKEKGGIIMSFGRILYHDLQVAELATISNQENILNTSAYQLMLRASTSKSKSSPIIINNNYCDKYLEM